MSAPRYELRNRVTGARGYRYNDRDRAERELARAVPARDWFVWDHTTRAPVAPESVMERMIRHDGAVRS